MIIEIYNGKEKIYNHRKYLMQNGFKFKKRSYEKSFYSKKVSDNNKKEQILKYCKINKLKCVIIEESYIRNANYRTDFLATKKDWTICAYCGFPLKKDKITVDHIIPVDKAKKNKSYARILMKILKIHDINEPKNLVAACQKCNNKKRTKMGLWLIRGFLGKSEVLWAIRWVVRIVICIIIIAYMLPTIV